MVFTVRIEHRTKIGSAKVAFIPIFVDRIDFAASAADPPPILRRPPGSPLYWSLDLYRAPLELGPVPVAILVDLIGLCALRAAARVIPFGVRAAAPRDRIVDARYK